jgi:hypothetical protein
LRGLGTVTDPIKLVHEQGQAFPQLPFQRAVSGMNADHNASSGSPDIEADYLFVASHDKPDPLQSTSGNPLAIQGTAVQNRL